MPDRQSAKFSSIMKSIKNRLVQFTNIVPQYVKIVASDNYEIYCQEEKFLYVRYYSPEWDTDMGVGRKARRVKRMLRVYMYMRTNLDIVGSDDIALLDQTGLSDLEEDVADALDDFTPYINASKLTIEPLHIITVGGPPEREHENDIGLVRSSMLFEIAYIPPKTQSEQYGS